MSELAALVLELEPQGTPGRPSARDAQGVFFNLLARADAALAKKVHDETEPKPYGLALGRDWLRFTLIDPALYATASSAFYGCEGEVIRLGGGVYRVAKVRHDGHPWARLTTHTALLQAASPEERELTLEFATPTTFRRGTLNVPLPEPKLVFSGLVGKWNAFSPVPVDAGFLGWLEEFVAVSRASLETKMADGHHSPLVGFTGRVSFRAFDKQPVRVKQLGALARFAFYAGVGQKTTLGLGRARYLEARRAEEPKRPRVGAVEAVHPAWGEG